MPDHAHRQPIRHSNLAVDDARDQLGRINTDIFLSPRPAPEKQVYLVRPGDVLNKVARLTKTTPELLMRANGMTNVMLRIDQRIFYTPAEFSVVISRKTRKVVLLNHGRFFKQYAIRSMPSAKTGAALPRVQPGKITDKIAWGPSGARVIFTDKEYAQATFWITHSVPGHTLFSEPDAAPGAPANKPPTGGVGIAPEAASELAILLTKGNPVTVEN